MKSTICNFCRNHKLPYKTIYWRGINIGDWRFFRKFTNIKITNINNYMDTPTKPLLKMKKLEKKDMVAQNANIKSANCFSQTNLPNITLTNKYSCTVYVKNTFHSTLHHFCTKLYWLVTVQDDLLARVIFGNFFVKSNWKILYWQFRLPCLSC